MKASQWADRAVMWRRILDDKSLELATVACLRDSYRIAGTALISEADAPSRVDYVIECGTDWQTRGVEVRQVLGEKITILTLTADGGKWHRNGIPEPELEGCTDIDLGISPSTNALPAVIVVDEAGLPIDYSGIWRRVAAHEGADAARVFEHDDSHRDGLVGALGSSGPA